jgi:2-polyprenyl-6-methoxyphenol hydroxylase-like FAD-dependent oxidoreductase
MYVRPPSTLDDPMGVSHDYAKHADVRRLLHDTALSYGATIRRNTTVVAIDPEEHSVTLSSGQILRADVVIGADGEASIAREQLLEEEDQSTGGTPGSLMLFQ